MYLVRLYFQMYLGSRKEIRTSSFCQCKQMEYLVKWKHQPTSENSWVKNAISIQSKLSTNIGPHQVTQKSKSSNSILLKPFNMFIVSLFFLLFCCTSTSAQILISENLPFCDMTKTPNLIDMHRSFHHSRENPMRPPLFKLRV
jgi:hypothetical protein